MTPEDFESLLDKVTEQLSNEVRASKQYHAPDVFEGRVKQVLTDVAHGQGIKINPTFHVHAFPDIQANGFGVEVKTTNKDSWQSVGNSVFEGMRDSSVKKIYVVFGKMGGLPSVKWGRYEERITHVRISHAPRFVLEMDRDSPLFGKIEISYEDFSKLTPTEKMSYIRKYSRGRLKAGERLWWLEDENSSGIPLEIKLYMQLPKEEKTRLRAEGALLFPQIVGGSRQKDKYNDIAFFFLQHRNVFCPQTRDLYSAGSVAGKERGGNYLLRALHHLEPEMRKAARELPDELFVEYWGGSAAPENRIKEWLIRADSFAKKWTPSNELFLNG
jgi:hypothetical protein